MNLFKYFRFSEFVAGFFLGFAMGIMAIAPVKADSIQVHLASKHITPSHYDFNEFNPGISVTKDLHDYNINGYAIVGGYRNSVNRNTVFGGLGWDKAVGPIDLGIEIGVGSGYQYQVTPFVSPTIRAGVIKVNILPIAARDFRMDGVALGLSLEFKYK